MRGMCQVFGAAIVLSVCASAGAQPAYRFVEIVPPAPYENSWATAVSDHDQIAGGVEDVATSNRFNAYVWDRGTLTVLPIHYNQSGTSVVTGINTRGQIAGNAEHELPNGSTIAMAYRYDLGSGTRETLVTMGTLDGYPYQSTTAGKMNNAGDVAIMGPRPPAQFGEASYGIWPLGTVTSPLWVDGYVQYGLLPGGINSRRDMVGELVHVINEVSICWHGGYSAGGGLMVDVGDVDPSPEPFYSRLVDVNESGLAVGWSECRPGGPGGSPERHAATYQNGVFVSLGTALPGSTIAEALAVNDDGVVVGYSHFNVETAVAWYGGVPVNLSAYMPPGGEWLYLNRAMDINRRGVIVGYGTKLTGGLLRTRGFALIPADVYVMSSGDTAIDDAVTAALETNGLISIVGVPYTDFDGRQSISPFSAVYVQANANTGAGDMPGAGQTLLADYVNNGGGLVTSEGVLHKAAAGEFAGLLSVLPAIGSGAQSASTADRTFTVRVPNTQLNDGLPISFSFPVDTFGFTESTLLPVSGSLVFYDSDGTLRGALGRVVGAGRSLSLSVGAGTASLADPEFTRLLANSMRWASGPDEHGCSPEPLPRLFAPNPVYRGRFGASMASDGVRLAVTRWDSPALLVYAKDAAGAWAVEAELSMPGWSFTDNAVAIHGNRVAVTGESPIGGGDHMHRVHVFTRSSAGVWSLTQVLDPGEPDDLLYGGTLALSDFLLAVGGAFIDGEDAQGNPVTAAGKAWMYYYCGNQWCHEATLTSPNPFDYGRFGGSLAIMFDPPQLTPIVLVMADGESTDQGVTRSGRLYAVRRVTTQQYYFEQELPPANPQDFVQSPMALSTFGNRVAVGWHVDEDPATDRYSGAVEIWRRDGFVNLWTREAYLWHADHRTEPTAPFAPGDMLGGRVFLGDGILAAVASYLKGPVHDNQGGVVLFRLGSAGWTEDVTLREPDAVPNIVFGPELNGWGLGDVAIVGDEVLAATYSYDAPGVESCGAVARFGIGMTDCNTNGVSDACDIASGTSQDADGDGIPDECHCIADYNRDGFVDGIDSDDFENDFNGGLLSGDINGDGFIDGIDYDTFYNVFTNGC